MTRYQSMVASLSMMLEKARAPNGPQPGETARLDSRDVGAPEHGVSRSPRSRGAQFLLPPAWQRSQSTTTHGAFRARLWRTVRGWLVAHPNEREE